MLFLSNRTGLKTDTVIGLIFIAFLLTRRFGAMLILATLICLTAMLAGVWLSFHLDSAPAPTIILILSALFLPALVQHSLIRRHA